MGMWSACNSDLALSVKSVLTKIIIRDTLDATQQRGNTAKERAIMSSPQAVAPSDEETKVRTVMVNGTPKEVRTEELTFEQVVDLAFPNNPWGNPNTIYTVAYRRGEGKKPQGAMVQGGDPVKVKDGMIFDVTPTDKS
jgi:hypothetical protein